MAAVQVIGVSRRFGALTALDQVSIDFEEGGFYGLLGPSGSGKTTLLRLIAGFDFPDAGRILIGGESMERVPVERRRIGMMFQNYALFPNMSVADNVAFGLAVRGRPKAEIRREVGQVLDLVQLSDLGSRRPHQLSGGQRQRVALARAIVTRPKVLLLDEPLSALDKALRLDMQVELRRIQREVGITTIFVTHDQEEALTMSDRIGILSDGRLIQEGTPEDIYEFPKSTFVATFLGESNIFTGEIADGGLMLKDGTLLRAREDARPERTRDRLAVRPERITIEAASAPLAFPESNVVTGRVVSSTFAGNSRSYLVDSAGHTLKVIVPNDGGERFEDGAAVRLRWSRESTICIGA
ncbi:MAG: ABC transporter ATP-binding protein [Alphaproteobacteria bacterium]